MSAKNWEVVIVQADTPQSDVPRWVWRIQRTSGACPGVIESTAQYLTVPAAKAGYRRFQHEFMKPEPS